LKKEKEKWLGTVKFERNKKEEILHKLEYFEVEHDKAL